MKPAVFILVAALAASIVSLALSLGSQATLTRRLARAAIWLVVLALPIVLVEALLEPNQAEQNLSLRLARGFSGLAAYGGLCVPTGLFASLALRRASRAARRRPR